MADPAPACAVRVSRPEGRGAVLVLGAGSPESLAAAVLATLPDLVVAPATAVDWLGFELDQEVALRAHDAGHAVALVCPIGRTPGEIGSHPDDRLELRRGPPQVVVPRSPRYPEEELCPRLEPRRPRVRDWEQRERGRPRRRR